jgi:hypothetical protein
MGGGKVWTGFNYLRLGLNDGRFERGNEPPRIYWTAEYLSGNEEERYSLNLDGEGRIKGRVIQSRWTLHG